MGDITAEIFENAKQGVFNQEKILAWVESLPEKSHLLNLTVDKESGKRWTLLHWLAEAEGKTGISHPEIVSALLAKGANPHQGEWPDKIKGDTPFNIAAPASPVTGRLMTIHWLESALMAQTPEQELNRRSGSHGSTLGQYLGKWSLDEEIEDHLEKGVAAGMNPAMPNNDGWTALHAAAAMGRTKTVEALCKVYTKEQKDFLTTNTYEAPYGVIFPKNANTAETAYARYVYPETLHTMQQDLRDCLNVMKSYGIVLGPEIAGRAKE